jgi:hypothetical protein
MRIAVKGFRGNHTNLVTLSKACLAMIEPMRQKKDGRETVTVGHLRSPGKDDRASSLNRPIRSATRHCLGSEDWRRSNFATGRTSACASAYEITFSICKKQESSMGSAGFLFAAEG